MVDGLRNTVGCYAFVCCFLWEVSVFELSLLKKDEKEAFRNKLADLKERYYNSSPASTSPFLDSFDELIGYIHKRTMQRVGYDFEPPEKDSTNEPQSEGKRWTNLKAVFHDYAKALPDLRPAAVPAKDTETVSLCEPKSLPCTRGSNLVDRDGAKSNLRRRQPHAFLIQEWRMRPYSIVVGVLSITSSRDLVVHKNSFSFLSIVWSIGESLRASDNASSSRIIRSCTF